VNELEGLEGMTEISVETIPQFYADEETLKAGSGYYTFMNFLPADPNLWVENCPNCQKAMTRIMLTPGTEIEGIQGTAIGLPQFQTQRSIALLSINPASEFWVCSGCCSVWTSAPGFWLKVKLNGEALLSIERIKMTEEHLKVEAIAALDIPIDPGTKPSPDSTKCPYCHVWRNVSPYQSSPEDMMGRSHHICPRCHTGEIYDPTIETKQEGM
jgi:hypothetical protein